MIRHPNAPHGQIRAFEKGFGAERLAPTSQLATGGQAVAIWRGRWAKIIAGIVEWRSRARARHELMALDDHDLWDIGLTRSAAAFEASKPPWRQ
jgi:uncharacterized protein YjiS (DUF1127 family)